MAAFIWLIAALIPHHRREAQRRRRIRRRRQASTTATSPTSLPSAAPHANWSAAPAPLNPTDFRFPGACGRVCAEIWSAHGTYTIG